jgi:hypothetical protein
MILVRLFMLSSLVRRLRAAAAGVPAWSQRGQQRSVESPTGRLSATCQIELFTIAPPRAARDALVSGTWDLAGSLTDAAVRTQAPANHLPLLLGAVVLLAALSSSSGGSKRDRW